MERREFLTNAAALAATSAMSVVMPRRGGPKAAYDRFEEDFEITKGPEGIYSQPHEIPGWDWDWEADGAA